MGRRSLDNIQVGHILEVIKKALGHLSRIKMEAAQSAGFEESQVMLLYTRVRRLQDYMQLASANSQGAVEIDLTDHDDSLVASCLLSAIGEGEVSGIRRGVATGNSGSWTKEKAHILTALTLEFANCSIESLPGVSPAHSKSVLVQKIMRRIDEQASKVQEITSQFSNSTAGPSSSGVSGIASGVEDDAGFMEGVQVDRLDFRELHARATGTTGTIEESDESEEDFLDADPDADSAVDEAPMEEGFLLDPSRIRDPRLRRMMVEDMRGLRNSRRTKDYRIASIHLCSILEQVILEYAMPRASELGLVGPIDSWRLPVILVQLLGDDLDEEDRALLRQILTSRNLLFPAIQLRDPREATADSFSEMLQLTLQMLACLTMRSDRAG